MLAKYIHKSAYSAWLRIRGRAAQERKFKLFSEKQFADETWNVEEQTTRLAAMLTFAYQNVPYYRQMFDEKNLTISQIAACPFAALQVLPLLDKSILRDKPEALTYPGRVSSKVYWNSSGGSTGVPTKFLQTIDVDMNSMATAALFDTWTGYSFGQPKVVLWGSERDLLVGRDSLATRLGRKLRNELPLNSFRLTEDNMYDFVAEINKFRPKQIVAYVDSAFELARFIKRERLEVHQPSAILTSAGTLYPSMRTVIERAFRAPVFNRYGSREVGCIGCECQAKEGLHYNPLTHHIEVLRPDGTHCGDGEVGEIIITLLTNYKMPLIRYRIGDMGALRKEKCTCGRSWPVLKEVAGRTVDVFTRADGSPVSPLYFVHFFGVANREELEFIDKFQIIQTNINRITFKCVTRPNLLIGEEQQNLIKSIIREVMGQDCTVEIMCVPEIPKLPSGKFQYAVSQVARGAY